MQFDIQNQINKSVFNRLSCKMLVFCFDASQKQKEFPKYLNIQESSMMKLTPFLLIPRVRSTSFGFVSIEGCVSKFIIISRKFKSKTMSVNGSDNNRLKDLDNIPLNQPCGSCTLIRIVSMTSASVWMLYLGSQLEKGNRGKIFYRSLAFGCLTALSYTTARDYGYIKPVSSSNWYQKLMKQFS